MRNGNLITFDYSDTERVDLATLGMPLETILYIAWLRSLRKDLIKLNLSIIMGFEGRHRSSKSLTACLWASIIDPTFLPRMELRIVKSPEELMREIIAMRDMDVHGGVIVIDEGGAVVPNDEYFSQWYKTLSRVFQIFGYLNPCIFFCALNRENVGAKFRKLFNYIVSCKRKSNEFAYQSVYELAYNPMFKNYMHKLPKFLIAGHMITLKRLKTCKPPQDLIDRYIAISTLQKDDMMDSSYTTIKDLAKPKGKKAEVDYQKIIDAVIANKTLYETKRSLPNNVILDSFKIKMRFPIKITDAKYVKDEAERIMNSKEVKNG